MSRMQFTIVPGENGACCSISCPPEWNKNFKKYNKPLVLTMIYGWARICIHWGQPRMCVSIQIFKKKFYLGKNIFWSFCQRLMIIIVSSEQSSNLISSCFSRRFSQQLEGHLQPGRSFSHRETEVIGSELHHCTPLLQNRIACIVVMNEYVLSPSVHHFIQTSLPGTTKQFQIGMILISGIADI